MVAEPMRILLLYWHPDFMGPMRVAVQQHLHVLEVSETPHELVYYRDNSPSEPLPPPPNLQFDAVILHNTFLGMRWQPWFYSWKCNLTWIRDLACPKIALPQDEYDHAAILDEWLFEWGISIIFTNFDEPKRKLLYPIMHNKATFYYCFTGYIDEVVAAHYASKLPPISARPNDLVYRATHLPYWFGRHGQLKHQIAQVIKTRAQAVGLKCDISTRADDTILGDKWLDFLASGRAVIGCESGSSVLDRRGEIQTQIQAMLRRNPELAFIEANAQLPAGWDDYQFFAISPRHFEAIVTKTCQILVEGHYDGILEPNRHYLPLKRDYSNLDSILEQLRDHQFIQTMVDCAYNEIYLSGQYTYRRLAKQIEQALLDPYSTSAPAWPQRHTMIENESKENFTEILERQSVVERHLHAALQETKENLGKVQGKVEAMTEAMEAERAAWQSERLILNAERKKWFMLIAVITVGAMGVIAIVSVVATYLVLANAGTG